MIREVDESLFLIYNYITMNTIKWNDFEKIELRTGTIVDVQDFPEARTPAYIVTVDFGDFGHKRSSAQITNLYDKEELIGKQIIGVINFLPKKIGSFMSEFLITGFYRNDGVVLAVPDKDLEDGLKLG